MQGAVQVRESTGTPCSVTTGCGTRTGWLESFEISVLSAQSREEGRPAAGAEVRSAVPGRALRTPDKCSDTSVGFGPGSERGMRGVRPKSGAGERKQRYCGRGG